MFDSKIKFVVLAVCQDESSNKKRVNVHEFEDENLDPFTNAELQTIDDLKELKDVLQNVTMGKQAKEML